MKLSATHTEGKWGTQLGNRLVQFDCAVMDLSEQRPGQVFGYMVSVHGVDLQDAAMLSTEHQRALGIGAQIKNAGHPAHRTTRVRLNEDGTVTHQ